jgi:sulfatase modifying factor 1
MAVRWVLPVLFLSAFALAAPSPAYSAGEARRLPPTNAEMVFVPGGDWSIGCAPSDSECFADERPRTTAPGRAGFWLDATEVTAGQYRRYVQATGAKPPAAVGFAVGDDEPVVNVSWGEAVAFCTWADKRLPTEIEWETAARGTLSDATFSAGAAIDHDRANLAGTGGRDRWAKLAPVGSFERNSIGIFDMAGNVWEWCEDWYDTKPHTGGDDTAPAGTLRVLKGGAFNSTVKSLRISNRGRFAPTTRHEFIGFRCARSLRSDDPAPGVSSAAAAPSPGPTPPARTSVPPTLTPAVTARPQPPESAVTAAPIMLVKKRFPPSGDEMAWLPPGEYEMGCVRGDSECSGDEQPRHRVVFKRGLWMSLTEVSLGQYKTFVSATKAELPRQPEWVEDAHPVVNVTWDQAVAYCSWVGGRLPTEAEWENAARGGFAGAKYPQGRFVTHDEANFDGTGGRDTWPKSAPTGSFGANPFGLFDLLGNVREWCQDWYDDHYYSTSPVDAPPGPTGGTSRCARGGSWTSDPGRLRLSYRDNMEPSLNTVSTGFRCVVPGEASRQ